MSKFLSAMAYLAWMITSMQAYGQCTVTATASSVDVLCGDTVRLNAQGQGITVFTNDFNGCSIGSGWSATSTAQFNNPCGASYNGSCYLWMGNTATAPRNATTNALDLSTGGTISFFMKYAVQAGTSPCEGPDLPDEGISLQYSNNGGPWTTIAYYAPNGGNDPNRTTWQQYTEGIPVGAQGTNVRLRWIQLASSNRDSDHWGLENVEVVVNPPNATYTWQHTGIAKSTGDTPPVVPTSSTTYTVVYNFGSCTQSSSVNVTVRKPSLSVTANPTGTVCPGTPVTLTANSELKNNPPTTCGPTNNTCNVVGSTVGEFQVGNGTAVSNYNTLDPVVFGDFGDAHVRTQIIYRAAELSAAGISAGKILSLLYDIARIDENPFLRNFSIQMGCTNQASFSGSNWINGLTTVYNNRSHTTFVGWNEFILDTPFNWDGVSNIVVQICVYEANGEPSSDADWGSYTRNHVPGFNALQQASTNFSDANCTLTSGQQSYNLRPNTRFGMCSPRNIALIYNWSPATNLSTTTGNPTVATPNTTTTYTVTVNGQGMPAGCAVNANYTVNIAQVGGLTATFDPVCVGGTLQLRSSLPSTPPGVTYSWTGPGGWTGTGATPTRTPAVAGVYSVTASAGGCTNTQNVTVTLDQPPVPGTGYNATICQTQTAYNLFTGLTGSPQSGGTWTATGSPNGTSGLSAGILDATKLPTIPGTYQFTYTVTNNNSCGTRSTTVNIAVEKAPFAGGDSSFAVCNVGGNLNLFTFLKKGPSNNNPDAGGTWTDLNAPPVGAAFNAGAGTFNVNGLATGAYRFKYSLNASTSCPADDAAITVNIISNPSTGGPGNTNACSDGGNIDLENLLTGSYDGGGTWSNTTPLGGGSLSGKIFNPFNAATGNYRFKYSINLSGCPTAETEVLVTLYRRPNAGISHDSTICESKGTVNLLSMLKGSPQSGGTYTDLATSTAVSSPYSVSNKGGSTVQIEYRVAGSVACPDSASVITLNITDQPNAGADNLNGKVCYNAQINLNSLLSSSAEMGGYWIKLGNFNGNLDQVTGIFDATGNHADTGIYNFAYILPGTAPCVNDSALIRVQVNGYPLITNSDLICSASRTTYKAELSVTGGHRPSYQATPAGGNFTDGGPVYTYTSAFFPSASQQTITISDANNCGFSTIDVIKDCNCVTQAGSMSQQLLNVCEGDSTPASLYQGGYVNEGDDTLSFYLHTGSDLVLGTVLAVSKSPVFGFKAPMQFGVTYYVSSGAGDDSSGFAARKDPCFVISKGTPIVFRPKPSATLNGGGNTCPGIAMNLSINFSKGTAPFSAELEEMNRNQFTSYSPLNGPSDSISVSPIDSSIYRLNKITDSYGCVQNYAAGVGIAVNVNESARATMAPLVSCSDGQSNKGSFAVNLSGAGNSFTVVYSNSLNGAKLTFAGLTKPQGIISPIEFDPNTAITYTLDTVFDNSGSVCPGITNGSISIYPTPTAAFSGNFRICPSNNVRIPLQLTGVGPWEIVYNDGVGGADQSYTTSNRIDTLVLSNPGPGLYNYTLVSVTDKASGSPQCTGTTSGICQVIVNDPVQLDLWIEDPLTGNRTQADEYCEGFGPRNLVFIPSSGTGSGNSFSVDYLTNGSSAQNIVVSRPETKVPVDPNPGSYVYSLLSIVDQTTAACLGTGSGASIKVNPTPIVSLTSVTSSVICQGSSLPVLFNISGNAPISFVLQGSGADTARYTFTSGPGAQTFNVRPQFAGTATYTLIQVSDGSNPTCSGATGTSFSVTVNPAPTATFTIPRIEVCQGTPVTLNYTLSGSGSILANYQDGLTPTVRSVNKAAGSSSVTLNSLAPGNYTFAFTTLTDNSPAACPGTGGPGVTQVIVRPTPSASLNLQTNPICFGNPDSMIVTCTGNGPFAITYTDNLGTIYPDVTGINNTVKISIPTDQNRTFTITQVRDGSDPDGAPTFCAANPNVSRSLTVHALPTGFLSGSQDVCRGSSEAVSITLTGKGPFNVSFQDDKGNNFNNLSFPSAGTYAYTIPSAPTDSSYYFNLSIADGNTPTCANTGSGMAYINVNPIPNPDFTMSKNGGCSPLGIMFYNIPESNYQSASCLWNFGDGAPQVNRCDSVAHVFVNQQIFPVTLTVTSEQNCSNSITKNITVYPDPVAQFSYDPQLISMSNSLVRFFNESSGASTFNWRVDSVGTFAQFNPLVQLPADDEGYYEVCLTATSSFGCSDSICKTLKVNGDVLINIPNTFTPNEDGYNEEWKPVILGERPDMYELIVFNRWGQEVFRTTNPDKGWDGRGIMNEICQPGTYSYMVNIKSKYSGAKFQRIGHVNLVK